MPLLSFVWFALLAASVAVAFVCFWFVCFPFVFSYAVEFFLIFLLSMSSGEIGKDAIPFHGCCRWSSFVPFVLCVLRDGKSTGKLTTSTIAAVFKIYNVAMLFISVVVVGLLLSNLYCVFSMLSTCKLTTSTAAAILKVYIVAMHRI